MAELAPLFFLWSIVFFVIYRLYRNSVLEAEKTDREYRALVERKAAEKMQEILKK